MKKNTDNLLFIEKVRFKPQLRISNADTESSYATILTRIESATYASTSDKAKPSFFLFEPKILLRIASAILVFVSIGIITNEIISRTEVVQYTNTSLQAKKIVLPDGSNVWLRTNSSISCQKRFLRNRNVELSGEALFVVAKNADYPFTVQSKLSKVTVVGTTFSIRAYGNENFSSALLKEGCVKIRGNNSENEYILKPGEKAKFLDGADNPVVEKVKNIERELAWQNRKFEFENETFESIMLTISDAFEQKIELQCDSILNKKYTLKFNKNESFDKILKILTEYLNLNYRIENRTYIIYKKKGLQ